MVDQPIRMNCQFHPMPGKKFSIQAEGNKLCSLCSSWGFHDWCRFLT